jgi:tetratricopeptide (TPR) repeat protein
MTPDNTDTHQDSNRPVLKAGIIFLLFLIVAFAVYLPALGGPFVLDDRHNIQENWHIRIQNLEPSSLFNAGIKGPSQYRPLPKITFALNYYFNGYDVKGFRAVNVFFHAATAFGLFLFLLALSKTPVMKKQGSEAYAFSLAASLLWLVHPLATQSVNYIVQRMAIMAALFFVFSLYFFVKARMAASPGKRWIFAAVCALCGLMAFLSKENSATLVFVLLLLEWCFFQKFSFQWVKGSIVKIALVALAFIAIVAIYTGFSPLEIVNNTYQFRDFTPYERILTQFRVIALYLSLIFLPLPGRFTIYRDFDISHSIIDPLSTLASLTLLLGLFIFAFLAARRTPFLSFAIFFFFITLAPESSIIGLEIAFDHRLYLPSMLIVAAIVWLIQKLISSKNFSIIILGIMIAASAFATVAANRVWADDITFFRNAVKTSPQLVRPWTELSIALVNEGFAQEAVDAAQKATQLDPDAFSAWYNYGKILAQPGVNRLEESVLAFRQALGFQQNYVAYFGQGGNIHNDLYIVLTQLGRIDEAGKVLDYALSMEPEHPDLLGSAGRHMLYTGNPGKAVEYLKKALEVAPPSVEILNNLAIAFMATGYHQQAYQSLNKALAHNPENIPSLYNMARLYSVTGDADGATVWFYKLLDAGFDDWQMIDSDPGMETLRLTPAYENAKAASSGF